MQGTDMRRCKDVLLRTKKYVEAAALGAQPAAQVLEGWPYTSTVQQQFDAACSEICCMEIKKH
jgi:hypothetical protein